MTLRQSSCFLFPGIIFIFLFLSGLIAQYSEAAPILDAKIGDVTCRRDQQDVEVPIYVQNGAITIGLYGNTYVGNRLILLEITRLKRTQYRADAPPDCD